MHNKNVKVFTCFTTENFTHASWTQNDTMASKSVMAALSVSFTEPRFSCGQIYKTYTNLEMMFVFFLPQEFLSQLELSHHSADLSAGDFLADEEIHLLHVFRGVVCATGRGQSVSPSSPRLLVVTGQGLSQVPMCYESAKTNKRKIAWII